MIPISRPSMGEPEAAAARRAILSGWTTQGPEVQAFEEAFAQAVGAPHACAVSSCTTALHLALMVAGVRPGDEVLTASHSFIATANAIGHCGATPVFVDIEPGTWNLDPALVEAAITPRTRAILCVHQMGLPCDLRRLGDIARRHELPLVEDAACAAGSQILWNGQWQAIGRPHGDIACFSFHPRKVISTGDGGMVTTRHAHWDRQLRLLRQHGMSVPDTARHGATRVVFERYPVVGYNYRLYRHPGRRRARAARAAACASCASAACSRSATRSLLAQVPGLALPQEPALGAQQLAELLRAAAAGAAPARGPARGDAGDAGGRRGHAPRHHVQPPRGRMGRAAAAAPAAALRGGTGRLRAAASVPGMTEAEQAHVAQSLARACAAAQPCAAPS
jgi:hypothetical protein